MADRQEALNALRRVADLERRVSLAESSLARSQAIVEQIKRDAASKDESRLFEITTLKKDLVDAQQRAVEAMDEGWRDGYASAIADNGYRVSADQEIAQYRIDNARLLQALQTCADSPKSQAQQLAAEALGETEPLAE